MSDQVECAQHGQSSAAIVCCHLPSGEQLGFHHDAERDPGEALCPTAWCDACHDALEAAGDWHEGWQMTAIAAKYLGAIGAYRTPDTHGFTFMVITGARWAQ